MKKDKRVLRFREVKEIKIEWEPRRRKRSW